jgi:carbonic anhydrase/acetyltransferase-like protein (isoleucine patch superfamily)
MYLGRITIGRNSSVGLKSHVAAGSVLPEDTFIGANSSSYEMDDGNNSFRGRLPKSNVWLQLFCIFPIQIFVVFVAALPWMGGLLGIVMGQPGNSVDDVRAIITWWATPHRISFHYLAQALNVAVKPFVWFGLIVIIKKILNIVCGPAKPKAAENRTRRDNFRTQLVSALVPYGNLKSLTRLFGAHYEFTSMAVRAMGGKVGRRVYWPGTGPSIQDFDLLDIGDDVVFGSRSHIITSDAVGIDIVRIGNGAMIADRVVLSPGANVGERTVLGSGAFIRRNQDCVPDSVWVGNRKGSAVCVSSSNTSTKTGSSSNSEQDLEKHWPREDESSPSYPGSPHGASVSSPLPSYPCSMRSPSGSNSKFFSEAFVDEKSATKGKITLASSSNSISSKSEKPSSSSPFGRAFYEGLAPYHVFGQSTIFLYSTFISIFVQVYWNVGTISTIVLSRIVNNTDQFNPRWYRPLKIYAFDVCIVSSLCVCLSILSVGIAIAAKWLLLGRRKAGSYDWDKSSYCQRWQLYLTVEAIRSRCFGGNGVLGMLTGTHYCVLYFRLLGAKIGKDCALFAGGRPSLMFTEPDLLTLGDRVTTDDASLVCHINSRGRFSLNELSVGDRSVLRSGSRLLSGARMGSDCVLLEHTLVMAGDEAENGVTYQGWPADVFTGDRLRVKSGRL